MKPYLITQAKLITYSGKVVPIEVESKVFTEPVRKVKDMILDASVRLARTPETHL